MHVFLLAGCVFFSGSLSYGDIGHSKNQWKYLPFLALGADVSATPDSVAACPKEL
jgi:hypothetical protein